MLENPPDDRTDACGVSDALPSEGLPGATNRSSRIPDTESCVSGAVWYQTQDGTRL